MRIGKNEFEEILKGQDERFDRLEELIKSLIGTGIKMPGPEGNQSSSSQQPQQPVSSPEDSGKSEEEKKEEEWEAFFNGKITDPEQKTAWKVTSGLVPGEAQTVWSNGWEDLTEKGGISKLENKKVSYTSEGEVASDVELLNHRKKTLDLIHEYIVDIRNAENLSLFDDERFSDEKIKGVIGGAKVPASRDYAALKKIRDDRVRELFKEKFGLVESKSISDDDVDAWRKTGLGGDGTNERKAFDNGWTKPEEIKDGKVANYTTTGTNKISITTNNINVSIINKNELKKAHDLLSEIKATKGFKELIAWKEANEKRIGELKYDQLPEDNLTAAKARELWNDRWDASDIQEENGDIKVVNPKTKESVIGYDKIIELGVVKDKKDEVAKDESAPVAINPVVDKPKISEENIAWRKAMGGAGTGSRNQALDGTGKTEADNIIMDEWFARTEIGGGTIASGKQRKNIEQAIKDHRLTFFFKMNEVYNEEEGDGLTEEELTNAREKLKEENRWKSKKVYKPLTSAILNKLLAKFLDKNDKKDLGDLDKWLRGLGGYVIEDEKEKRKVMIAEVKEINGREELTGKRFEIEISGPEVEAKEKEWSKQERLDLTGTYRLAFVHHLIDFDLDKYRPNEEGVYDKEVFLKLNQKGEIDNSGKGIIPILTGGGKTTKDVACLINGGETNVILVCPNEALAGDAYKHHIDWLQKNEDGTDYKCVIHGFHHGPYETVQNDLIYYEDKTEATYDKKTSTWKGVIKKGGKKGLSILQAGKILGYTARSAIAPAVEEDIKIPSEAKQKEYKKAKVRMNEDFEGNKAEIKKKLIPKEETIIIFDEAHFSKDAKYQEIQKRLVGNGYQVLIMSATFPKKPFSITTSHQRDVRLVNRFEPEYLRDSEGNFLTKKDENGQEIKDENGQPVKIEKWEVQKTQIFLRTTEDEWKINPLTGEKIEGGQILQSGLTAEQRKLLDDNDIAYVIFDRTNQEAVTGITKGMKPGTLFFANPDHEMGFSPFIHNVILTGETQTTSLGKQIRDTNTGKVVSTEPWLYDNPEITPLQLASMIQQIGRVARLFPGTAYLLTKELQDVDALTGEIKIIKPPKDLSYKFVSALLAKGKESKDILETLKSSGANMGDDPNFLRAAVALPYKFGMKPEEIFVGVQGQKSKPFYPIYGIKPNVFDKELWRRHLGNPTLPKIDKEMTEQIILLIIIDFLEKNEADITRKIDMSFENPLIKKVWGKEVPKAGGKEGETVIVFGEEEKNKVIESVRKVLHTIADKYQKKLEGYKEGKNDYSAKEIDTFQALVRLYRVVNKAEIKIEEVPNKGKMETIIRIIYPPVKKEEAVEEKTTEKIAKHSMYHVIKPQKEIGVWVCYQCSKVNNGYRFCEECRIDVVLSEKLKEEDRLVEEELQANIEIKDNEFHWRW